jgi:cell division protein FtsI (penicillin-binding protein 3)
MATAKRRKNKFDSKQVAFTRFMFIVGVFAIWILGISTRLVYLQVSQHDWLRARAVDQRQDVKKSKLLRGTIYDRDERPLAMSVRAKTLYADAVEITDIEKSAKALAKHVKLPIAELTKQLADAKAAKKRFVPLIKKVDEETAQKLNKTLATEGVKKADEPKFEGLHWIEDQKRSYPHGSLAAQVIGFANADDVGMAGIEQSQEDLLHGAVVKKLQERDRLGRIYEETVEERERPGDIALTIGTSFQHKVEQALEAGVKNANAKSGIAIAMNPKTGEILALANYPTFDLNGVRDTAAGTFTNHAVQSVYSPGSVMKLITYGSGLEKNHFTPDEMISSGNGTIDVAGHVFKDSHAVGTVSYEDAFAHSSNVCAIRTALRVGKDDFYSMLQKMGFGSRTGVELPAETSGIVRAPERWNGDSLASMSIGYEIGVTALQMATAFATIANDGIKVKPRIIKEIRAFGETPVVPAKSENERVVSSETARDLRRMMRRVVLAGTGKRAQLNGWTSAGKTGTAWKFNAKSKSIDSSKYISSFIGMAPADNPEVVIAVVIDEPRDGARDGGGVAAPIFKQIAEDILPELRVPQDGTIATPVASARPVQPAPAGEKPAAPDIDRQKQAAKPVVKQADKKPENGRRALPNTSAFLFSPGASSRRAAFT